MRKGIHTVGLFDEGHQKSCAEFERVSGTGPGKSATLTFARNRLSGDIDFSHSL